MTVAAGRVCLNIRGQRFNAWTSATITRDLHELAGTFELCLLDTGRLPGSIVPPIHRGDACTVAIDGEVVLTGRIDVTDISESGTTLDMKVRGRDRTGDLVDCAAAPNGPAEYRNIGLLAFATAICAPFGIPVRIDMDEGAKFAKLALNPHDTALAAIESAARQRSALVTSDGVGGLVLTQGGKQRAPWHLVRGENLIALHSKDDGTHRFSDVFVKGQSASGAGCRVRGRAAASVAAVANAHPAPPAGTASAGILMTGHAQDPEITRWRPFVKLTRSQSGMTSAQEQAEWLVRVFKSQSIELRYTVLDWRAGPPSGIGPAPRLGALWRPNTLATVFDPPREINGDMLIAGVVYKMDEKSGITTALRVVGPNAYEEVNEAYRRRGSHGIPQVQPATRGRKHR